MKCKHFIMLALEGWIVAFLRSIPDDVYDERGMKFAQLVP